MAILLRRNYRFIIFGVFCCMVYMIYLSSRNKETEDDDDAMKELANSDGVVHFARARPKYNELYESQIQEDERKFILGLGDNGAPATVPPEEEEEAKKVAKSEAFNLLLSNRIPYNRRLPDSRHPNCKRLEYNPDLPTASIIIIFHNERWSSLIRTIHSVLNETPPNILHEIILVDDASTHKELGGKLNYYLSTRLPANVKLYRLAKRSGLIRARLHGAKKARGDVLMFLDAHCEVTHEWLQPLLARIQEENTAVVVPIIDVIDDKTFEYQNNGGSLEFEVGGFTWSGHFTWIPVSKEEQDRREFPEAPTRSPTMAGGLFAINREYFWEIGSYDTEMDIWGGENLEMSFRVWQCGGLLETIPCSRVGHIFRSFHPYSFPNSKDTHGINTARLVKVWMDEYQRLFFHHRPDLKTVDIGDITPRLKLKEKLGCKPFSWYLKNVYPKFIPDEDVLAWGQASTRVNNMCLDNLQKPEEESYVLGMYTCHAELTNSQYFSLTDKRELRREFLCAEPGDDNQVNMEKCNNSKHQKWTFTNNGQIRNDVIKKCIDTFKNADSAPIKLTPCTAYATQIWTWSHNYEPKD